MTRDEYNRLLLRKIQQGKQVKPKAKRKEHAGPRITETQIQKQCIEWFSKQYPSIWQRGLLVHIANERKCSLRAGKELKEMGVRRGLPDLQLFFPNHGYHGLLIEMKRPKSYARPEQKELMQALENVGYKCAICKSLEEFRNTINSYLI